MQTNTPQAEAGQYIQEEEEREEEGHRGVEREEEEHGIEDEVRSSRQAMHSRSSSAESDIAFQSEHLGSDANEAEGEASISAYEHTVEKLYEQLQRGFHGYTGEQH